jgi:DNA-directed RNA polymerase specialized sigma24 family protein
MNAKATARRRTFRMAALKKEWVINPEAFRRLLVWLDSGSDSRGERYLEVRRRLTLYFDRKNCLSSDELADETLNRIARKLEEKGAITEVSSLRYCYIVAKFVFLENLRLVKPVRSEAKEPTNYDALSEVGSDLKERMFSCLEKCLGKLGQDDRTLVLDYYRGERRTKIELRAELARRLGLSMNAVSIRACRIRNKLEACIGACTAEK